MSLDLSKYIASIPDYPKKGIIFRDIMPLLANPEALQEACNAIVDFAKDKGITKVVAPEARGFILASAIACRIGAGFVPARKPNKLPREVVSASYNLEYGSATLEMQKDAIKKGDKVLVMDDLLATGGTIGATMDLVEQLGGQVVAASFMIELEGLAGRQVLKDHHVDQVLTLMTFPA